MTIDVNRAHEVDNGLIVNDTSSGNTVEGPFYTGGPSSPVGLNLPESSLYVQNLSSGIVLWHKFGNGINDWEIYPAEKISFDPSGTDISSTNVQEAILSQVGRHYGKDFSSKQKLASENTTGNSFAVYDTLNFNVSDTSGINQYRLNADFFWGHNSASNDIRVKITLDGNDEKELRIEPKDQGGDQRIQNNLLYFIDNLSQGSHSLSLEYRPASNSRQSRMYESTLEVWRVE